MKVIGRKSNDSSSKNTYQKDRKEAKDQSGEDIEIVEVHATNRAHAISAENSTNLNVRLFNMGDSQQPNLFVRTMQIKDLYNLLRDVSLSRIASLRLSFRMYCFGYSCVELSLSLHPMVSADDVITPFDRQYDSSL